MPPRFFPPSVLLLGVDLPLAPRLTRAEGAPAVLDKQPSQLRAPLFPAAGADATKQGTGICRTALRGTKLYRARPGQHCSARAPRCRGPDAVTARLY